MSASMVKAQGGVGVLMRYSLASVSCERISNWLLSVYITAGGGGHDAGPPLMPFKRTKMPESTVRMSLPPSLCRPVSAA